jgi:hypothetical protein
VTAHHLSLHLWWVHCHAAHPYVDSSRTISWSRCYLICAPHLQLDVDLSQAPRGGVVQLELWCGRSLLASAPLLLLPPLTSAEGKTSDALLVELLQHTQHFKWSEEEGGSGIAAWLNDMGQLLHTAACCASGGTTADSASTGPGSWGGVVSAIARQHASSPALLSGALALGEALLEYAKSEGLPHTSSLLSSAILNVHQRLEELQGAPSAAPGSAAEARTERIGLEGTAGKGQSTATTSDRAEIALLGEQQALRQRLAPQGPKESPSKLESRSQHSRVQETAAGGSTAQLKQAAVWSLRGFRPKEREQQYALWVAASWSRIVILHSLMLMLSLAASLINIARAYGASAFLSHLPLHLICATPYTTSTLLALFHQHRWVAESASLLSTSPNIPQCVCALQMRLYYLASMYQQLLHHLCHLTCRWQETSLMMHSVCRSVATVCSCLGLLPVPHTYMTWCRIRLDIWGDILIFSLAEPVGVGGQVSGAWLLALVLTLTSPAN